MKKIIRKFILILINYLLKKNKKLAKIFSAVLSSLISKKKISSNYDGKDWIFRWSKYAVVTDSPLLNTKGIYDLIEAFFHDYQLNLNDVVFNIGTDNGYEIPFFCDKVGEGGIVYAVEPNPDCCRRLNKLKQLLNLKNLIILDYAIGETEQKVFLSKSDSSIIGKVIKKKEKNDKLNYEINQISFDKLINKHKIKKIDYVKVNIEGYEINFLKGFKSSKVKVKNFCISCHDFLSPPVKTFNYVKLWLKKNNYQINLFKNYKKNEIYKKYYLYGKDI
tara:strand:- start:1186 stop:2013 length:828 start_codon:yes stop_codon:yes gene_type:complete